MIYRIFLTDAASTELSPLSLHDALPISLPVTAFEDRAIGSWTSGQWDDQRNVSMMLTILQRRGEVVVAGRRRGQKRSEEHTSELQSPDQLVCRLLLEKKLATQPHDT